MRDHDVWFLILVGVCVVVPYLLGIRPRTRRQWRAMAIVIAFMAVMLIMARLHSA